MTTALVLVAVIAGLLAAIGSQQGPQPLRAQRPEPERPQLVTEPLGPERLALVSLPDLSGIDRSVVEPAYRGKPGYCLLVLGPQAATRVWLVEDGETLYIDRDASGDLTGPGKAFAPTGRSDSMIFEDEKEVPHREWAYDVGDLTPRDGSGRHTGLRLVRYQTGDRQAAHILSVRYRGATLQYAGWAPLFAPSRAEAPVVHVGGPLVPRGLRGATLSLNKEEQELNLCVGTPGLGKHSFAFVGYEAVPRSAHPIVEVAWPTGAGVLRERFRLRLRC
jgi:hypothetical protein